MERVTSRISSFGVWAGWLMAGALAALSACGSGAGAVRPDGGAGGDGGGALDGGQQQQDRSSAGSGNVHFTWRFGGGSETCAGAGVHVVQVMLAGAQTTFPCASAAGQSGTVAGVPAGDQAFSLTGLGIGTILAKADGVASVSAGQTTDLVVDLLAANPRGGGDVTFQWSFEGGKACSDVGAAKVTVSIDGQVATFDCDCPQGQQGTVLHVGAGQPAFTVVAGASAFASPVAQGSGQVLVTAGQNVLYPVVLRLVDAGNSGRLVLRWYFGLAGCAAARVDRLSVQIGGGAPFDVPCLDFASPGKPQLIVPNLPPGPTQVVVSSAASHITSGWSSGIDTVNVTAGQDTSAQIGLSGESTTTSVNAVAFAWTFAGKTCAEAGVGQVNVSGPNIGSMQALCTADGTFRLPTNYHTGTSSFTLSATATGGIVYGAAGSFATEDHCFGTVVLADMQPSAATTGMGSLALDFAFSQAQVDCAGAGLDRVHLFLTDGKDALVAGSDVTASCAELPITLPSVASAGTYNLNVQGLLSDGTPLYEAELVNLTVTPPATSRYRVVIP
jgi:hypothetical protein